MAEAGGDEKASGGTPRVLISYASQDAAVAAALVEALERRGIAAGLPRGMSKPERCTPMRLSGRSAVPRPAYWCCPKVPSLPHTSAKRSSVLPPRSARLLRCESTLRR
jgi:hypothetical protein